MKDFTISLNFENNTLLNYTVKRVSLDFLKQEIQDGGWIETEEELVNLDKAISCRIYELDAQGNYTSNDYNNNVDEDWL
ncbi:hypothetical protein AS034_05255 [[Bacillus] enclensis]|uniref:Uncharacterized protein n=1 Tax=[Bacillus] enclensis TaxID=1402860 RepID=A0A0V8HMG3_9BACI|nr:hypothetical protein [[Bacillus] enclensis]KSU63656.1 hypothetical protein AS034_05255 [[Bacillus] enclensis]SCB87620.1 hypothetical protein GA0061094_1096 [[Bacillus] enclensis]